MSGLIKDYRSGGWMAVETFWNDDGTLIPRFSPVKSIESAAVYELTAKSAERLGYPLEMAGP